MPRTVNVGDAKAHLSQLIARAEAGEDVIIARDGVPAARIVPWERPIAETIALMRRERAHKAAGLCHGESRGQRAGPRLMAIVVDVSIAAAWCFRDEQADAAERAFEDLPRSGGVVPGIFRYEIRTVLIVNERRGRIDQAGNARFLMRLLSLRLLRDDAHDEDTIMALAREHRLSAHDAAYLETALRRGDSLATLDKELANAAAAEGVARLH